MCAGPVPFGRVRCGGRAGTAAADRACGGRHGALRSQPAGGPGAAGGTGYGGGPCPGRHRDAAGRKRACPGGRTGGTAAGAAGTGGASRPDGAAPGAAAAGDAACPDAAAMHPGDPLRYPGGQQQSGSGQGGAGARGRRAAGRHDGGVFPGRERVQCAAAHHEAAKAAPGVRPDTPVQQRLYRGYLQPVCL